MKRRYMHPDVHCSTIYNSQDVEATYMPIDRGMGKEDVVHIYTVDYYSAIKTNESELFVVRWIDLESVMQSEVSQKEKNKYRMLTHIYGI